MPTTLLVEDNDVDAELMTEALLDSTGVERAPSLTAARRALVNGSFDLLLLDIHLPDGNGLDFLDEIVEREPELPVVFVTATNDARCGIAALRAGAREYLVKDRDYLEELALVVSSVLRTVKLETDRELFKFDSFRQRQELALLRDELSAAATPRLVGNSDTMVKLSRMIDRAAGCTENVLICGETGTGKELVAKEVHSRSARAQTEFVAINCATIPDALLESELFGHRRGAFTGASRDRTGFCERVGNGTLFLDEIAELPLNLQPKILRLVQEREFVPLGSTSTKKFNGRLIVATNVNLQDAVADRSFREDLYYRLHVMPVSVPPLRTRLSDIPELTSHFIGQYNNRNGTNHQSFPSRLLAQLATCLWPGNVRELENFVIRVLATLDTDDGASAIENVVSEELATTSTTATNTILAALERHRWNREAAAQELGISRTTLWRRMVKHRLVHQ